MPAKRVDAFGHGEWVVGVGSCGGYGEVCEGVSGASKEDRGRLLDEIAQVTGWSRDNARRRLARVVRPRAADAAKRQRSRKYSYDATKRLQRVWAFSGFEYGKFLQRR